MRESALEKKFRQAVERIGGLAPKWVSPGNRGVPDRIVILPEGRTVYVELKAPGKPLQPLQRKWAKTLRALNHKVYKIDSEDDIERFIREVIQHEVCTSQVSRVCDPADLRHALYRLAARDGFR